MRPTLSLGEKCTQLLSRNYVSAAEQKDLFSNHLRQKLNTACSQNPIGPRTKPSSAGRVRPSETVPMLVVDRRESGTTEVIDYVGRIYGCNFLCVFKVRAVLILCLMYSPHVSYLRVCVCMYYE